jgi:hypothetical protein
LEDLDTEVENNSAWEIIREIIKISANKPWFDQACSNLVGQRKQPKLQWLQDPSE